MTTTWDQLKLAAELQEAVSAAGWAHPTQVQAASIPPMLRGSDVALQSRTGTGKTGAFVLPLLQRAVLWQHAVQAKIGDQHHLQQQQQAAAGKMNRKQTAAAAAAQSSGGGISSNTSGASIAPPPIFLVLVPSVELCSQTVAVFDKLGKYVRPRCQVINIPARIQQPQHQSSSGAQQRQNIAMAAIAAAADGSSNNMAPIDPPTSSALVLISTPAFLVKAVKVGVVPLEAVLHRISALVIDEADMLQSHTSMQFLYGLLPPTRQSVLLSATLTESVARLKGALLNHPVAVRVDEEAAMLQQDGDGAGKKKKKDGDEDADKNNNKEEEDDDDDDGQGAADDAADDEEKKKKSAAADNVEIRVVLPAEDRSKLKQHYLIATDECTKHTLLYSLFRFQGLLLPGKTLIFVDDDKEPYRLQHFLEQLGVSSLVYDLTLPVNARCDILTRFQEAEQGVLICTDHTLQMAERLQAELGRQTEGEGEQLDDDGDDDDEGGEQDDIVANDGGDDDDNGASSSSRKKTKKAQQLQKQRQQNKKRQQQQQRQAVEPGLSRGIDFNNVGNVILFQGVKSVSDDCFTNYLHRIGRTARAGNDGQSIALFTVPESKIIVGPLRDFLRESSGEHLRPFKRMDRSQAAALQYRVQAAVHNVTRHAAKKLRVANVAAEMGRSNYLSTKLNSADAGVLRRLMSGATKQVRGDKNLRNVPDYMGLRKADETTDFEERVSARHLTAGVTRANMFQSAMRKKRATDPLSEVAARVASSSRTSMKRRKVDPEDR